MWSPFLGLYLPKVKVYRVNSDTGQPLDLNVQQPASSVHTDIKRDKNGKMVMVRHRSKNNSVVQDGGKPTFKDVKKNKNNNENAGDKGKNDGGGGAKAGSAFTTDEDAKLKELKEGGKTWKEIAQEMGRAQHELKDRWKEIGSNVAGGGNQKNSGGGDQGNKDGGGDFTDDENKKIEELLANNTPYKKIAQELNRTLNKPLKDQIAKLKDEADGGDSKTDKKDGGGDNKKGGGNLSKKDKQKIKELLESNTGYKKIADELGRTLDDALKEEIGKIKAEQGGKGGGDKKDGGGDKKDKNKKEGGDCGGKKDNNKKDKKEDKKDNTKANKPASNAPSHRSEARFTMEEWRILSEDELFTFGELQLLSEIIMKDTGQSWLKVASRFHDKTGRRVHPDDIRDKFDQMAEMGR